MVKSYLNVLALMSVHRNIIFGSFNDFKNEVLAKFVQYTSLCFSCFHAFEYLSLNVKICVNNLFI